MTAPKPDDVNTLIFQLAVAAKAQDTLAGTTLLNAAESDGISLYDIIWTQATMIAGFYDSDPDVGSTWTDDVQQTLLRRALGEDN